MILTPEQNAFIEEVETTHNNIRLDAVAGSGKTTTLVRAAQVMPQGESTIALAFNKKIQEVLAESFPSHVHCKTFNGLGHNIWMGLRGRLKLDSRKTGAITSEWCKQYDLGDYWKPIRALADQMKKSGLIPPGAESKLKVDAEIVDIEAALTLAEYYDIDLPKKQEHVVVNAAVEVLEQSIREAYITRIDFEDQLYMSTYFTPDIAWPKYDTILVDEAQDLSDTQHDMVSRLMHPESRLIIVGDPKQAIYGWRGASADSMDVLSERFNLKLHPLTVCFRCPKSVVKVAQEIVPWIKPHEAANDGTVINIRTDWKPEDLETGSVVLCRNNAPLVGLAFDLLGSGIPAFFNGRNLGANLKKIVDKIPLGPLGEALASWYTTELSLASANEQFDKMDKIEDQYEVLQCVMENYKADSKAMLKEGIEYLFRKEYSPDAIELSTIHKSKGKEWDTVYFLNQGLIPGRWVQEACDTGKSCGPWMLEQEHNLRYVAVTRSLDKLVFMERERKG